MINKERNTILGAKVKFTNNEKYEIIDLLRPLSDSWEIAFIKDSEREGIEILWHSSAHILGYSLEQLYPCLLWTGPVKEHEGFYYDANFEDENTTITTDNLADIQKKVNKLTSQKHTFQRIDISYEKAIDMFKENKFKLELINKHIEGHDSVSVYRVGDFVDLWEGPHLPHSGYIGEILILNQSGSYWKGNVNNPKTQRVHGISFSTKEKLKEWKKLQEEILKRDHRVIGKQQKLFTFEAESPGSVAFLPNGTHIYNKLIEFLRKEYLTRGYQEVITPNVFSIDLWKTSGHYDNYKDDMFLFDSDNKQYGIKPMNCPGHWLLFPKLVQSYNDLPLRIADFGVLHRNEISGALSGLTRVRKFQQDDSHIFCTEDQIQSEIQNWITIYINLRIIMEKENLKERLENEDNLILLNLLNILESLFFSMNIPHEI